jgi:membrane protein implicated in regulation of membrane protease activity
MPIAFGIAVLFSAACIAAVVSHYAIDAVGDYLVPHDTYDHIGHVSRSIATLVAAGFALASAIVFLAAALADARRFRGALRAVLGTSGVRSPLRLALAIVPTAFAVLVTMESIDGRIATGIQPGLASALGGSIVLGSIAVLAIGILVAVALWRALRMLSASHRRITEALERLIGRRAAVISTETSRRLIDVHAEPASGSALSRRAGKRAPPQAA